MLNRFRSFNLTILVSTLGLVVLLRDILTTDADFYAADVFDSTNRIDADWLDRQLDGTEQHLAWFVQVSDLHISIYQDPSRIKELEVFTSELLPLIKPRVVVASGDLTDGKNSDYMGSKQNEDEWIKYEKIFNNSQQVIKDIVWLDLRGNHDNFDVESRMSKSNLFKKYGSMRNQNGSYIYFLNMPDGDKYAFIGVDATIPVGLRRPFNFFGSLNKNDLELLGNYSRMSSRASGTLWFGHYPTSTIYTPSSLRAVMTNGVAYLCGHLHTLGGLLPSMYGRHSNGILELELADWKHSRAFRIMAFDNGLFSFKDYEFKMSTYHKSIFVLITNPKSYQFKSGMRREPLGLMRNSTHIRFLVFSNSTIARASVFIDNNLIGLAKRVSHNASLFVLPWSPANYAIGVHSVKVVVEDSNKNMQIESQEFSLEGQMAKSFNLFNNFIILGDQTRFTKGVFYLLVLGNLFLLSFFRCFRTRFTIGYIGCGFVRSMVLRWCRRLAILASVDYVFWPLLLMTIYVPLGPWFVGEVLDKKLGVCFIWGVYVNGGFLKADVQYLFGSFHMVFFQLLLILHLSFKVESRFLSSVPSNQEESESFLSNEGNERRRLRSSESVSLFKKIFNFILANALLAWLVFNCAWSMVDLAYCYSLISAIICPLKTWSLFIAIYLHYRAATLSMADLKRFVQNKSNFDSDEIEFEGRSSSSPRRKNLIE